MTSTGRLPDRKTAGPLSELRSVHLFIPSGLDLQLTKGLEKNHRGPLGRHGFADLRRMAPQVFKTFCLYVKHLLKYCETEEEYQARSSDLQQYLRGLRGSNFQVALSAEARARLINGMAEMAKDIDQDKKRVCLFSKMENGKVTFGWSSSTINEREHKVLRTHGNQRSDPGRVLHASSYITEGRRKKKVVETERRLESKYQDRYFYF